MKNKLLNFIDLLIFFFNQGYSLQETLDFCSLLNYEKEVKEIKNYLNQGLSLDEIFIMLPFPTLFKEYYSFFKNEFTLETALKKSIEICKKRDEYKNILLKKLAYPIILLIFLFVFSIFTVFYLLPQVEILFNDFDIQKSFIIQCLFVLLHAIPVFLTLITIINIILMIFIYQSIAKQKFNQIDFLINHTHFIKKLICKYYSLKFAIYYNELLIQHYDTTSIIETLYDKTSFGASETLSDSVLFAESLSILKRTQEPFFSQIVTISTHAPNKTPSNPTALSRYPTESRELVNTMEAFHSLDRQLGSFLDSLKACGLYERSVIAVVSDHDELGKNVLDGREHRTLADREVAFVLLNTPYTISYEETAGQIDVYPTLLDVMGCNEYGWKGLGYSLFRTPVESAVYWDGSSLGNRRSPLYSRQTQAWDISRLMITGDFFSGKSFGYDEE